MSILSTILEKKLERVKHAKSLASADELRKRLRDLPATRDFAGAIKREGGDVRLIAEIKKASPSKGVIRKDFDPLSIASIYEKKGANAVSVLTEEDFFQGRLSFVREVKGVTSRPVLRKDFIFDEYQIYESRVHGADAILLIAAVLERDQAKEYLHLASELGLHVLFEIHDEEDLGKALLVDPRIIGINNRNLKTLKIDLSTTLRLQKDIPREKTLVSESGIKDREDVAKLGDAGIDAMLIGTSFMEAEDIGRRIDTLTRRSP
ncbi:MAG TPA: indole-3-glycerol phosphate synthase TrpC [Dissulfurispiraceae bacterium]